MQSIAFNEKGRNLLKARQPVIADVARAAAVSTATVSRALNGSSLVSPEMRARVQRVARELNYQMHSGARNLRRQRTEIVALVIRSPWWSISDPFLSQFAAEISIVLKEHGYDLLIAHHDQPDERWIDRLVRGRRVDGLILIDRAEIDPELTVLTETGIPFVVLGRHLAGHTYHTTGLDNNEGGYLAGRHLVELGHRRIATITGPLDQVAARDRFDGFRRALAESGVCLPNEAVIQTDYRSETARAAMAQLLDQTLQYTAVFIFSDFMSIAALDVIHQRGLVVPKDLSIVSFDDIPLATYVSPPLTTVRSEMKQFGHCIATQLLEIIEERDVEDILVPVSLIVRGSAAHPPEDQ